MAFIANKNFISSSSSTTETNIIQQMSQRLIDNLLETDSDLTEDRLGELFQKQISITKEKNTERKKRIDSVISSRLDREIRSITELLDGFKKEGTA